MHVSPKSYIHDLLTTPLIFDILISTCKHHCSFFVIDREELKFLQVTQIDIGFYALPSQAIVSKQFSLTIGEIKVVLCIFSDILIF